MTVNMADSFTDQKPNLTICANETEVPKVMQMNGHDAKGPALPGTTADAEANRKIDGAADGHSDEELGVGVQVEHAAKKKKKKSKSKPKSKRGLVSQ